MSCSFAGFDSGRREISGGKLYSALGVSNCKPTILHTIVTVAVTIASDWEYCSPLLHTFN